MDLVPATDRSHSESELGGSVATSLRRFACGEAHASVRTTDTPQPTAPCSPLDAKTAALVQMGALVALGATRGSYDEVVGAARGLGASDDEIVGTLLAVATTVGLPRLVSAAVSVAWALGYDIDAALEVLEVLEVLEEPARCSRGAQ